MIRRERRVAGPRFRYIVAGERGAVEYVTLAGSPLAISYHSPQPLDGVRPVPCDVLDGPATGRSSAPVSCASGGVWSAATRRSSGAL